jgi:neutral ceramidase
VVGHLRAGIASVEVPAPLGADMVGFLRRYLPVGGHGQPLELTALVVEGGEQRAVIVGLDLLGTVERDAMMVRSAVADAARCPVDAVFVNSQHTHAAPPPPGMLKLGGLAHELTPVETSYWEDLVEAAATAAALAVDRLQLARVGAHVGEVDGLTVNRRERTQAGTILGWNPDGPLDQTVSVLRFDTLEGTPLATVVNFACHPVVVGPDVDQASSDFVGPLRAAVRQWTGADCLFLQGCAGNVLPLEAFMDVPGPEVDFGRRLALVALSCRAEAEMGPTQIVRSQYGSAVPIIRYRRVMTGEFDDGVAYAVAQLRLPLIPHPSLDEMYSLGRELDDKVLALKGAGGGPEQWNPLEIHKVWAASTAEAIRSAVAPHVISAPLQVIRIGDIAIVGIPGEAFNEIGSRIKMASPAPFTLCCGYTNGALGYLPTTEEYPFGGYEVGINHRHYGNPSPIAIGCDVIVQETALEVLGRLFAGR